MLSSIWIKIIAGVLALSLLGGGGYFIVHKIQHQQQITDENKQLKQVIKDIADLKKKTDALDTAQADIMKQMQEKDDKVVTKQQTIKEYISSPEAQKSNRESSDILKETVRRLSDEN